MLDFIIGLLIDLALIGGTFLLILSFFKKFKKHRTKMFIASVVLIVIGLIFLDTAALSEAYQKGMEWGESNIR